MKSRSGFTAVHAPPSHLVTSLDESLALALDAANDALGTATIAANAMAAATVIFEAMRILPKKRGSTRAREMGTLLLTPGRERCGAAHEQLMNESASRASADVPSTFAYPKYALVGEIFFRDAGLAESELLVSVKLPCGSTKANCRA